MNDLVISEEILKQAKISPTELRVEIAVYLYEKKRLTMGQAKRLAGLDQIAFQKALAGRDVYIHYDLEDLEKDLRTLDIKE